MTDMDFRHALGRAIRKERLAQNKTLRDVADGQFIALAYLSEIERGKKEASSQTINRVATALGLRDYDLVIEAGYLMAESDVPDSPQDLFAPIRDDSWRNQYADLKG